jgi:hypothetical protein
MARAAVALEDRRFRLGRAHVAIVAMAVIAVWLVFVFGRALGDLDRANARQEQVRAETLALELRLAADRRELELVQTDAFQALQARGYGMGAPGEQVFSLTPGAPPPPDLARLGGGLTAAEPSTPLDAWLELLFGR